MTIQFRKASRKKSRLRLGISAPPGCGKTMGSLFLAYGIMKSAYPNISESEIWDKVFFIDTEEGSGELYTNKTKNNIHIGEFQYNRISAPFTAIKYLDNIHAAEAAGAEVIIIDSLTHAWAGSGGLLDKQGKIADADPKKNSYTAWRTITPEHNALVDAMLQSSAHIIGTMRSKTDHAMETGVNGKIQIRKLGLAPVMRDGVEYEFTVFFDISDQAVAHATKDRTDLFSSINATGVLEKREFIITPKVGEEIFDWLNTGAEPPPPLLELVKEMAADVQNSTNVAETVAKHQATYDRLQVENPSMFDEMSGLLEARYSELNPFIN